MRCKRNAGKQGREGAFETTISFTQQQRTLQPSTAGQIGRDPSRKDPVHAEEGGVGQLRPGQEEPPEEVVRHRQGLRCGELGIKGLFRLFGFACVVSSSFDVPVLTSVMLGLYFCFFHLWRFVPLSPSCSDFSGRRFLCDVFVQLWSPYVLSVHILSKYIHLLLFFSTRGRKRERKPLSFCRGSKR